jgi:hypothetical protein
VSNNRVTYWRKLAADYQQLALTTRDPQRRLELTAAVIRCLEFAEDAVFGAATPDPQQGVSGEDIAPEPTVPL